MFGSLSHLLFFFFQAEDGIRDLTVTGVQTCALPICALSAGAVFDSLWSAAVHCRCPCLRPSHPDPDGLDTPHLDKAIVEGRSFCGWFPDRKSTRLNSSHSQISYAVFCLKKKKKTRTT